MATILYLDNAGLMGGAQRTLVSILAHLDRSRFEPSLVAPAGSELEKAARDLGVEVHNIELKRFHRTINPAKLTAYLIDLKLKAKQLRDLLRTHSFDIVHANSNIAAFYLANAPRGREKRIWHSRDLVAIKMIKRQLLGGTDVTIAISNAVKRHLIAEGVPEERIRTIYNGIDPASAVGTSIRSELGLPADAVVFTLIAFFYEWKGHKDFIFAFQKLLERQPEARALIVGSDLFGDNKRYAQSVEKLATMIFKNEELRLVGRREDVNNIIASSDVILCCSTAEPFGRVYLEAFANGKPVISYEGGAASEIIQPGVSGVLTKAGAIHELTDAMEKFVTDREYRESFAGAITLDEKFNIIHGIRNMENLYDELLEARSSEEAGEDQNSAES